MIADTEKLRTSIRNSLKKKLLFRGSLFAVIGAAILIYMAVAFSVHQLQVWGFALWSISILLIAFGLVPLKRINRLETRPHEILLSSDRELAFFLNKRKEVTLPFDRIEKIEFYDDGRIYGIAFHLKAPCRQPGFEWIYLPQIWWIKWKTQSQLFLPFFTKRSFNELQEHLE